MFHGGRVQVSAAKYSRAERDLKQAKPIGEGTKHFYEKTEFDEPEKEKPDKKTLLIAITSDRGSVMFPSVFLEDK